MVRVGRATGEVQVVFITNSSKLPQKKCLDSRNQSTHAPSSFDHAKCPKQEDLGDHGDETLHLWGKEAIEERLQELTFDLSPRAFFQLNPQQTSILYDEAIKALALTKNETVVDAYCGVGTIGLSLAKHAKEVRGMDIIPQAIENAKEKCPPNPSK